jgi:hypothetical protein
MEIKMYEIRNKNTNAFHVGPLADATRITQLDEGDVEWAIEEYGVCETDEHTIIEVDG